MKKKIIWSLIVVCLMASIWGGAWLAWQVTCPVWDRNAKECRQCNYSYPVFMGKTAVESRCANRKIKQNCDKNGYYSVPDGYVDPFYDFDDCKRYFKTMKNIWWEPRWNRTYITFINARSVIFVLGMFSCLAFIPFWVIKKIRKKCWGYKAMKGIATVMGTIAILLVPLGIVIDYVTRADPISLTGIPAPMPDPMPMFILNKLSLIFGALGILLCLVFIPFWIVQKIKKKCRGYQVIKRITKAMIAMNALMILLLIIVDEMQRHVFFERIG